MDQNETLHTAALPKASLLAHPSFNILEQT